MVLETLVVGTLSVNCYIVGSQMTREAAVIDPGGDAPRIMFALSKERLKLKYIILTHAHFDHVEAGLTLQERTRAEVIIAEKDAALLKNTAAQAALFGMRAEAPPRPDRFVKEGDVIRVGELEFQVIETPGHSQGGISLYMKKQGIVFTGDTLFWGSIGRTDLPGGDYNTIIRSIKQKLGALPNETRVLSGHGDETTIGFEKEQNPFFE